MTDIWKGSDVWQYYEYASIYEYASVTQVSVENGPLYSLDSRYARAWVVNMSRLHRFLCNLYLRIYGVLNVLKILNVSEV